MNLERSKATLISLIAFLVLSASSVGAVSFPDYFPIGAASHGKKTFQWTYGGSGSYTSQIGSTESVPYTSGHIVGTYITNWSDWGDTLVTNDGTNVKILGNATHYVSTDPSLTSHPSSWTFTDISDGLVIDQRGIYFVEKNLSSFEFDNKQLLFFELQDITVLNGTYNNAIVMWYLDTDYSYVTPDFAGSAAGLGLSVSAGLATLDYSITAFDIYGLDTGIISYGDIAASTGSLLNLAELSDVSVVPLPGSAILAALGLVGGLPWLKRGSRLHS